MIKLFNILNEIQINKPTPKFRNNDELANYLKKNTSFKKILLNSIWNNFEKDDDDSWDDVIKRWYIANIEQYGPYNEDDEIMIDDGDDNRIYISINPMSVDMLNVEHKLILHPNIFYWQFY